MSDFKIPEPPWNEYEERYLLAEILKKSSIPTATLVNIIKDFGIDPSWTDTSLPNGRSLSSCQHAYNALLIRTRLAASKLPQKGLHPFEHTASILPTKGQPQPWPASIPTAHVLPRQVAKALRAGPIEPPKKKRGRPTKSEFDRRQAEARERGEVWPRPRNKIKQPLVYDEEIAELTGFSSETVASETTSQSSWPRTRVHSTESPVSGSEGEDNDTLWTTNSLEPVQVAPSNRDSFAVSQDFTGDIDIEILDPETWTATMEDVECLALTRSYYCFRNREVIQASGSVASKISNQAWSIGHQVQEDFYTHKRLPSQRPTTISEGQWRQLVHVDIKLWVPSSKISSSDIESLLETRNILLSVHQTMHLLGAKAQNSESSFTMLYKMPNADIAFLNQYTGASVLAMIQLFSEYILRTFEGMSISRESLNNKPIDIVATLCEGDNSTKSWGALHWRWFAEALDIALVSHFAAHIVDSPEHFSALHKFSDGEVYLPSCEGFPQSLVFRPTRLRCLRTLIRDAEVWVLQSAASPDTSRLNICSSIKVLSEIWGPIWKIRASESDDSGHFFALGQGFIGRSLSNSEPEHHSARVDDAIRCHFVQAETIESSNLMPLDAHEETPLLIGTGLNLNTKCKTKSSEMLRDLDLRPHGTSASGYKSHTVNWTASIQFSGLQIGYQRQMILRHGTNRKQMLVNRWAFGPGDRNPKALLLWCGLEVSLCTLNARRVRLYDILRSDQLAHHCQSRLWKSEAAATAFLGALSQPDCTQLISLYNTRWEWREDIGLAIGSMLHKLCETGLQGKNFQLYHHAKDACDQEQTISLATKLHTWTNMLGDNIHIATFAIATDRCLSFPYEVLPGQPCRQECFSTRQQRSSLETFIEALPQTPLLRWNSQVSPGKYLPINDSRTQFLKVMQFMPSKELLVRLSTKNYLQAASMKLLSSPADYHFRECMDHETEAASGGILAYVMSDNDNQFSDRMIEEPTMEDYHEPEPAVIIDDPGQLHTERVHLTPYQHLAPLSGRQIPRGVCSHEEEPASPHQEYTPDDKRKDSNGLPQPKRRKVT